MYCSEARTWSQQLDAWIAVFAKSWLVSLPKSSNNTLKSRFLFSRYSYIPCRKLSLSQSLTALLLLRLFYLLVKWQKNIASLKLTWGIPTKQQRKLNAWRLWNSTLPFAQWPFIVKISWIIFMKNLFWKIYVLLNWLVKNGNSSIGCPVFTLCRVKA